MSTLTHKGWRREASPYEDSYPVVDMYGNPTGPPTESKREKRRRDMVDRVSRLHADTLERRDRVFHDLSEIFARTADELLPPPVFGTFDLSIPVGQLPPSLAFTDPVVPDMHPTPYLFALHRLSLERANRLLAIRLYGQHQMGVARKLYETEVDKIEDEYESASKGVVDRLLEGVEERRKRLMDEKEGEGAGLESFLDPQSRAHGTRRVKGGNRRPHHLSGATNGHSETGPQAGGGTSTPPLVAETSTMASLLGAGVGTSLSDPFNLAASLLPPNANALLGSGVSLLTAVGASLAASGPGGLGGGGGPGGGKKKPGGARQQPGLPPAHFLVTSGSYNQFGKSLAGLSALRGDEIDGDLGEVRRKRPRGAGAAGRRRANGD